jgi:hypothetical protein
MKCQLHEGMQKSIDEVRHTVYGGDGQRGIKDRTTVLEENMNVIKFIGGAVFVALLGVAASVIMMVMQIAKIKMG